MKFSERVSQSYERIETPIKELLSKLSPSQRWSLGILGAVVLLLLGLVVMYGPEDNRTYRVKVDPEGLLYQDLDKNEIPYSREGESYVVVSSSHRARVDALWIENPKYLENPNMFQWLYEQTSWNESSGQRRDKILDTKRRQVRDAIEALPGVSKAVVTVNMTNNSRFVLGENPSTASVLLTPESGRVPVRLAHGIRQFIAFSFGLKQDKVSLMDHQGPIAMEDSAEYFADASKAFSETLRRKMVTMLSAAFASNEFTVAVDAQLDRDNRQSSTLKFDPEGLVSAVSRDRSESSTSSTSSEAPGTKPNTANLVQSPTSPSTTTEREYEENEFENFASKKEESVISPSGEPEQVSILVYVSRDALARQINTIKGTEGDEKPTEQEIQNRILEIEKDVRAIPAVDPTKVKARVQPIVMSAAMIPVSDEAAAGALGYMQLHMREFVLGFLALAGCFLLYRAASRSTPDLEPLPDPVADLQHFLKEKEERDRVRGLELGDDGVQKTEIEWESEEGDQEAIDLLESISQFAEDRPDLTAAVLRNWLHEGETPETKKAEGA